MPIAFRLNIESQSIRVLTGKILAISLGSEAPHLIKY